MILSSASERQNENATLQQYRNYKLYDSCWDLLSNSAWLGCHIKILFDWYWTALLAISENQTHISHTSHKVWIKKNNQFMEQNAHRRMITEPKVPIQLSHNVCKLISLPGTEKLKNFTMWWKKSIKLPPTLLLIKVSPADLIYSEKKNRQMAYFQKPRPPPPNITLIIITDCQKSQFVR